jgi:hypothetical protein
MEMRAAVSKNPSKRKQANEPATISLEAQCFSSTALPRLLTRASLAHEGIEKEREREREREKTRERVREREADRTDRQRQRERRERERER